MTNLAPNNAMLITSSLKDGLTLGIFQDKFKVFCRGISTVSKIVNKDHPRFVDEFLVGTGFFLLIEKNGTPDTFKLASFLNTGVIEKSRQIVFERVMTIPPTECFPYDTPDTAQIPTYFKIEDNGDITPVSEDILQTLVDL